MILVDVSAGSNELIPLLPDCCPCHLPSGDVCIPGNGPLGPVLVGVEVKKIRDLLDSMLSGRIQATQLPKLLVDYHQSWLLTVGGYRAGRNGRLEIRRRGYWHSHRMRGREVPYGYVESFLVELAAMGVHVKQVYDNEGAAGWIKVVERWWMKEWDEHKGMQKFDRSAGKKVAMMPVVERTEEWRRKDQIARLAKELPGVGYDRGWGIAERFGSFAEVVVAEVEELELVPGIGKVIAKAALGAIHGK